MDFDLTLDTLRTNRQTSRPSHLTAQHSRLLRGLDLHCISPSQQRKTMDLELRIETAIKTVTANSRQVCYCKSRVDSNTGVRKTTHSFRKTVLPGRMNYNIVCVRKTKALNFLKFNEYTTLKKKKRTYLPLNFLNKKIITSGSTCTDVRCHC